MKTCYACRLEKPLTEFYRCNVRYYQRECKGCNKERKGRWHKTDAGKASSAATKLKARFGITPSQYDAMLSEQGGKCLVCDTTESYLGHRLAVDHCHTTGKIRGLLCKGCNLGLGHFLDNPVSMERAAEYIRLRG